MVPSTELGSDRIATHSVLPTELTRPTPQFAHDQIIPAVEVVGSYQSFPSTGLNITTTRKQREFSITASYIPTETKKNMR